MREIYKRIYDNPKNPDGTDKENELLGTFEVKQQIYEDAYEEMFIGIRKEDGKRYLVKGDEVSYTNGGTRYSLTEIVD